MARFNIYKLRFTTPLHIGDKRQDYGISQKTISSDAMYAAVTSCLAKMGEEIPDGGDLGFAISSLFPYYQKDKESNPVYFFPKPLQSSLPNIKVGNNKIVKKVQWMDVIYFSKILSGENPFTDNVIGNIKGEYLLDSTIDFDEKFITSSVSQRVELESRFGKDDAKPYYIDRVRFTGDSGLYFIVEGDTTLLDKVLPLLSLEGIGTDRNVGNGFFEYEKDSIEISLPEKSDYAMTLSMFFPESKEQLISMFDSENVAYDIDRRGGWITTQPYIGLRKNVIYGLTPCSVLKIDNMTGVKSIGRIVDLKPKWNDPNLHPIYRCGKALMIPIKLNA